MVVALPNLPIPNVGGDYTPIGWRNGRPRQTKSKPLQVSDVLPPDWWKPKWEKSEEWIRLREALAVYRYDPENDAPRGRKVRETVSKGHEAVTWHKG